MPGISSGSVGASSRTRAISRREGGADHQAELAAAVPRPRRQPGDVLEEHARRRPARCACRSLPPGLEVRHSRIRPLSCVAQVGLDRVEAHEGRQRHRVGLVALEGLARVLLGGGADVAALGVQDHRHAGCDAVDVLDQPLELVFGALRGEVGDLRLEGADQVLGRIDDGGAEIEDARGVAAPVAGELAPAPGPGRRTASSRLRPAAARSMSLNFIPGAPASAARPV